MRRRKASVRSRPSHGLRSVYAFPSQSSWLVEAHKRVKALPAVFESVPTQQDGRSTHGCSSGASAAIQGSSVFFQIAKRLPDFRFVYAGGHLLTCWRAMPRVQRLSGRYRRSVSGRRSRRPAHRRERQLDRRTLERRREPSGPQAYTHYADETTLRPIYEDWRRLARTKRRRARAGLAQDNDLQHPKRIEDQTDAAVAATKTHQRGQGSQRQIRTKTDQKEPSPGSEMTIKLPMCRLARHERLRYGGVAWAARFPADPIRRAACCTLPSGQGQLSTDGGGRRSKKPTKPTAQRRASVRKTRRNGASRPAWRVGGG
jgi:hypothetical protein